MIQGQYMEVDAHGSAWELNGVVWGGSGYAVPSRVKVDVVIDMTIGLDIFLFLFLFFARRGLIKGLKVLGEYI